MSGPLHKPYFENLDALRFFAFLSVFCSHSFLFFNYTFPNKYVQLVHRHYFLNGDLGVAFFLVLSGFLITWLLLLEKEANGRIRLGAFYMRRVLRIWPVYFLVVAAGFLIGSWLHAPLLDANHFPYRSQPGQLKWYLLFLANVDLVLNGETNVMLNVLWSVSIEEQFYLLWPLFFLPFGRKALPVVCWAILVACLFGRCFHVDGRFPTFGVVTYLAVGGLMAYYCLYTTALVDFFKNLSKKAILFIYLLFVIYVPAKGFSYIFGAQVYAVYFPFEAFILSGFFGFMILEQIYSHNSFFKFGKVAAFTSLGKISYGLYAYHMFAFLPAYFIASRLGLESNSLLSYVLKAVLAFGFTVALSWLSYRFFEKKILVLKKYFPPLPAKHKPL